MTNLCDVCGKPATQSMLRDLFGKSDEMRFVCSDHGFRIRDPADVAAIEQLHAAVKTAQELAATRLMEIERLQATLKRAAATLHSCRYSEQPMAKECDAVLAGTPTHEPCDGPHRAFLEMPEGYSGPVKISNPGAAVAEVTVYPSPQGASRDASSALPEEQKALRVQCICGWQGKVGELTELSGRYLCPECIRPFEPMPTLRTGPADLVGALQDVVHTDPGPVRAGKSARVVPSICGKPMPDGKGAGQCINPPGHEGDCDDMPF